MTQLCDFSGELPRSVSSSLGQVEGAKGLVGTTAVDSASYPRDGPQRKGKGWDPANRIAEETVSVNELALLRSVEEQNQVVDDWIAHVHVQQAEELLRSDWDPPTPPTWDVFTGVDDRELSTGEETENRPLPGRTYFIESAPGIEPTDLSLMREIARWQDAPAVLEIGAPQYQRGSLQYQSESSQAAIEKFGRMCGDTGSVVSRAATWGTRRRSLPDLVDSDGIISGNFLKKLLPGSQTQQNTSLLASPKQPARSPSPFSSQLKRPFRMWRKTGTGPVASGAQKTGISEDQDDGSASEVDEEFDHAAVSLADYRPDFEGFKQHILELNPLLKNSNTTYLVDRIAHQQVVRYKSLLNAKVKHLVRVKDQNCPSDMRCIASGGDTKAFQHRDPLSAGFDDGDEASTSPAVISGDSFPLGIPMPPTTLLPAEFECQLCYQIKKFSKPSDWTKHVIEDLQPHTCTWDRCREPKIFKRIADWVRHENEGHRHLEWWDCDVEDCRHFCYRRDNFLQHLIREHKYPEPKVKTKAAIKRASASGLDPTWAKVESCHRETKSLPQNEPCRFCGRTFPTWKKLTVHVSKHMNQIAFPIMQLVAMKEVDVDTIIPPVPDPPPWAFPASFSASHQAGEQRSLGPFGPTAHAIGYAGEFKYNVPLRSWTPYPSFTPASIQVTASPQADSPMMMQYQYAALTPNSMSYPSPASRFQTEPYPSFSPSNEHDIIPAQGSRGPYMTPDDSLHPYMTPDTSRSRPSSRGGFATSAKKHTQSPLMVSMWGSGTLKNPSTDMPEVYRPLYQAPEGGDELPNQIQLESEMCPPLQIRMEATESLHVGFAADAADASPIPRDDETVAGNLPQLGAPETDLAVENCPPNPPDYPKPGDATKKELNSEPHQVTIPALSDMKFTDDNRPEQPTVVQPSPTEESRPCRSARQMGVAKIRVELISISRDDASCDSMDSDAPSEDEGGPMDDDGGQGGRSTNGGSSSGDGNAGGTNQDPQPPGPPGGDKQTRERRNGGQSGGRKRRRQNSPDSGDNNSLRFACPYQVYEPLQDCLQRGPRNPKGGCDGMYRLRQHLSRRHMISFRCQTCWRSFDRKAKRQEHVETRECSKKPKPGNERFMDPTHETEVEKPCGGMSDDTWWKLFQLLIPGMEVWDLPSLKKQYYPYYIACDVSLTIPSLNFTDVVFPDLQTDRSASNGFEPAPHLPNFAGLLPSERPHLLSQTLTVPVCWSTVTRASPPDPSAQLSFSPSHTSWNLGTAAATPSSEPMTDSMLSTPGPSMSLQTIPPSLDPVASPPTPTSSVTNNATMVTAMNTTTTTTQLQRNKERLRARIQRVEGEATELREASQAARVDIGLADTILEDLMAQDDTSATTYETLAKLSKLLEAASSKLRKAI